MHRPSINTLTSLTEKLSRQNAPDLMNNNSNNICARTASSVLTVLQQYRWIWLNNIPLILKVIPRATTKYATAKWRFHTTMPYGISYHEIHQLIITSKTFLCKSEQTFHQFIIQRQTTAQLVLVVTRTRQIVFMAVSQASRDSRQRPAFLRLST